MSISSVTLPRFIIEIAYDSDKWSSHSEIDEQYIVNIAKRAFEHCASSITIKTAEISLLLTDNAKMQSLNQEFRTVSRPTNILSFPDTEINWQASLEKNQHYDYLYLGDAALGYEQIKHEAQNKNVIFQDHFKHLIIHAIMHMMGYDHIQDQEALIMESLEIEILQSLNISNPYKNNFN